MGYRTRLGRSPKSFKEQVKGLSKNEVLQLINENPPEDEGDGELYYDNAVYRPEEPFYKELYEIGKYYSFDQFRLPFYDFELDENEFDILDKRGLELIIDNERKVNHEYFQELAENPDRHAHYFEGKVSEWSGQFGLCPYNLNPNRNVVSSWLREYTIFQLCIIYRDFDWENDYLIYSGW